jgi:hypothetical protein
MAFQRGQGVLRAGGLEAAGIAQRGLEEQPIGFDAGDQDTPRHLHTGKDQTLTQAMDAHVARVSSVSSSDLTADLNASEAAEM